MLHVVNTTPINEWTRTYLESGHSFLPNDTDFGNILEILYPDGLPITKTKYDDTMSLMYYFAPVYWKFLLELKLISKDSIKKLQFLKYIDEDWIDQTQVCLLDNFEAQGLTSKDWQPIVREWVGGLSHISGSQVVIRKLSRASHQKNISMQWNWTL